MNYSISRKLLAFTLAFTATSAFAATTLDGVYSNAQAQRGSRVYNNICAHCHEGGEPDADPLIGADFVDRWREAPLSFLHGFYSENMPADEPGTLKPAEYLDVLAFLLKENGYTAGTSELKVDQLPGILMVAEAGPQPLPLNVLVKVVGCLAGSGEDWTLATATDFIRVREADETDAEELAASAALPAGSASYMLRNAAGLDAAGKNGQRVQAKGVLSAHGSPATINVLSLEPIGASCN